LRIATLEGTRGRLTGCIGCGCLSLRRCALLNPDDEAAQEAPARATW
jgi:MerR family redox-sensitive transcriptional activator SoxR